MSSPGYAFSDGHLRQIAPLFQSLLQTGLPQSIGEFRKILGTPERQPFAEVGKSKCGIQLTKLVYHCSSLAAPTSPRIDGSQDTDRKGATGYMPRRFFRP